MVLLDKLWDDVLAGPSPERGLGKLRKITTTKPSPLIIKGGDQVAAVSTGKVYSRSMSMPASPGTPVTPKTPLSARKDNVWRSVFHPGSNLATKDLGAALFDKPESPNSPTVYDWLYSGEARSKHQREHVNSVVFRPEPFMFISDSDGLVVMVYVLLN